MVVNLWSSDVSGSNVVDLLLASAQSRFSSLSLIEMPDSGIRLSRRCSPVLEVVQGHDVFG